MINGIFQSWLFHMEFINLGHFTTLVRLVGICSRYLLTRNINAKAMSYRYFSYETWIPLKLFPGLFIYIKRDYSECSLDLFAHKLHESEAFLYLLTLKQECHSYVIELIYTEEI